MNVTLGLHCNNTSPIFLRNDQEWPESAQAKVLLELSQQTCIISCSSEGNTEVFFFFLMLLIFRLRKLENECYC